MKRTRENSQVALIAWSRGCGLGGEPVDYVCEVHYFNSKKEARQFQINDWECRGEPMDSNNPILDKNGHIVGFDVMPDFRFQCVCRGTKDWKYAIIGYVVEMSPEEALRYFE